MSEIEKHHEQAAGQEVVNWQVPPDPDGEPTSNFMAGVLRRWYIVLLVFVLLCALGLPGIWMLLKPSYEVTGALRVDPIRENILSGQTDIREVSVYERFMNTEAEKITSSTIVQRVADALVDRNLSFFDNKPTDIIGQWMQRLLGPGARLEPAVRLKQAIVDEHYILVTADRLGELIKVTMKSTNQEDAKQIVDAFIKAYMDSEVVSANENENRQLTLLESERDALYEKIKNDRQTVYQLAKEYGQADLQARQNAMLQRVGSLLTTLTGVEAERIKLEAQVQLLERTKEQAIAPEELLKMRRDYINEDTSVTAMTDRITELEQELVAARQALSPTNPEIQNKVQLLEALKQRLEERKQEASKDFDDLVAKETAQAGSKQLAAARSQLDQTREYEKRLRETLSKEDIQTIDLGRKQLTIDELQADLDLTKERYDLVLRRVQDLELQRKRPARVSVYYYADVASINDKRVKLSVALVLAALVCGMGLAHLRDKADLRLRTPDDVARRIGIRIIGTTTSLNTVKPALLPEQIVGDYQTIRANLGLIGGKGIPRKLVVTSPGMKEGKTTFAVNLATSLAESGKKVLLIDGDLRKPDVARLLNLPKGSRGLQDVLCGVKFEQAVYSVASTGLDVLAADFSDSADAYELLALPSTRKRIAMISRNYDHVIIDTPPALGFPDALLWAKMGDAAILVSFAGQTTMPDLKEAKERLAQINVNVLGTVLSSVDAGHSYFRHGHTYHAQSRESAQASRRKLMFAMEQDADITDEARDDAEPDDAESNEV
jgi:capsular exopolysaccharide synthesis family protein